MDVSDYPDRYLDSSVSQVVEKQFQEHYLRPLGIDNDVRYVRLESMICAICRGHMLILFFGRYAQERSQLLWSC